MAELRHSPIRRQVEPHAGPAQPEFGAIGSVLGDYPNLVILLDKHHVTVSALSEDDCAYWAEYMRNCPNVHMKHESPLSSVFRGSYTSIERHPLSDATHSRYVEMLAELASHGQTYTVQIDAAQR